jgi:hypothetical protein
MSEARPQTWHIGFDLPQVFLTGSCLRKGCCQSNANPSPLVAGQQVLHNEKFAPFAKGGVSQRFKAGPPLDVSLVIEMVVYRQMH